MVVNSPFKVNSAPGHDASKVRASGPGLDTKGVAASLPVEFTIDARDAGKGLLTVQILVSTFLYIYIYRNRKPQNNAYITRAVHLNIVFYLGSRGKAEKSQHSRQQRWNLHCILCARYDWPLHHNH